MRLLKLAPKPTVQWSEVGSEVVVLDRTMAELLRLNPVRSAARDVRAFLNKLRSLELVEGREGPPTSPTPSPIGKERTRDAKGRVE